MIKATDSFPDVKMPLDQDAWDWEANRSGAGLQTRLLLMSILSGQKQENNAYTRPTGHEVRYAVNVLTGKHYEDEEYYPPRAEVKKHIDDLISHSEVAGKADETVVADALEYAIKQYAAEAVRRKRR